MCSVNFTSNNEKHLLFGSVICGKQLRSGKTYNVNGNCLTKEAAKEGQEKGEEEEM